MSFFLKKTLIFSLLFIINLTINSQNTAFSLDSLSQKGYNELSDLFYESKPDTLKAITYANAYFSKAIKEKDTMEMVNGKYYLADIKNDENIYLNYCDSLIKLTETKPNKNFPSCIYIDRSKYYLHKNVINKSLTDVLKVIEITKKIKNDSLLNISKMFLALLKSRQKKHKKSNILYKQVYNYVLKNQYFNPKSDFYSIIVNMPFSYIHLKKYDSAYIYCNKAKSIYKKSMDSSFYLGNLNKIYATINFKQKNFNKAISYYNKVTPFLIDDENYYALRNNFYLIAKCYDSLKNHNSALKHYLKVDSLHQLHKSPSENLQFTFKYLTKHYKLKSNFKKQLYYLDKLLKIKNALNEQHKSLDKTFTEEYDIPNLLAEKKAIIYTLEKQIQKSKRNKLIYLSLLFITTLLILYQLKKRNIYKKRFLDLVNQRESIKHITIQNTKNTVTNKHNIPNNIVTSILKELDIFEKEKAFLNSDNSLQALANKVNTNTNYLSKVINHHKNTTFSNYINNLRINYTVKRLKTDSLLRKYTIKAIANEVGFKNAESFSKAFYKFTEIKPSYFIKELEKTEINI